MYKHNNNNNNKLGPDWFGARTAQNPLSHTRVGPFPPLEYTRWNVFLMVCQKYESNMDQVFFKYYNK
jgi:hypothetical protein